MMPLTGDIFWAVLWKFSIRLIRMSDEISSISSWIVSFSWSKDRGRCLKTFPLRYPYRKKLTDLNLARVVATELTRVKNTARTVLCAPKLHPVGTRNILVVLLPIFFNFCPQKVLQHVEYRLELKVTYSIFKIVKPNDAYKWQNTNGHLWAVKRFCMEFLRVFDSPIAKILFVYCLCQKDENWTSSLLHRMPVGGIVARIALQHSMRLPQSAGDIFWPILYGCTINERQYSRFALQFFPKSEELKHVCAERPGDCSIESLTAAMLSGFRTFWRLGGFLQCRSCFSYSLHPQQNCF